MNNTDKIVLPCLLSLFVVFIVIELILRKKKNQGWWKGFYTGKSMFKDRNKSFLILEIILMIGLIVDMLILTTVSMVIPFYVHIMIYFLLLHGFRGLEQWMFKREDKEYQHDWLATSFFIVALFIFFFTYIIMPS